MLICLTYTLSSDSPDRCLAWRNWLSSFTVQVKICYVKNRRYIGSTDMLEANFLNTSTECYFANFFETYGWSQPAIGNQGLIFSQVHKEHAEIFSSETTQRVHCCDIALDYPIAYNGIFL